MDNLFNAVNLYQDEEELAKVQKELDDKLIEKLEDK